MTFPANDAEFAPVVPSVQALWLDAGATRVMRAGEPHKRDELWQGDGYFPQAPDVPAIALYLRIGSERAMLAELLYAVVARALGLPAPEAFLVVIQPGVLPQSAAVLPGQTHLCVGTRDIGGSTFAQLVREDSQTAKAMIRKWEHLTSVAVLDEWLANPDRNLGNILFVAHTLHIIDHAEAFCGSHRALFPLAEMTAASFTNKLANLLDIGNATARVATLDKARRWLTFTGGALDVQRAVDASNIGEWQTAAEREELIMFITERLRLCHSLLCNRLGHPQFVSSL